MNCYRCQTPLPDGSRFCLSCGADVSGETAERTLPVEADPQLQAKLQADVGADYVLERELGRGGMAAVFLATEVNLGRKVAIKVLPPELTFGRGLIERFKREARTAATLDHPHIIPIHRVSTSGNLFWYVMKYLEGGSLADLLHRDGQLPLDRTTRILSQVAEALEYAHEHGVIHRDMKPANVMIDARGWVTVTDFGIAKAMGTESLTGSGSMIGTPYYMSPEQCAGKKVTSASDQYALGVMAYQMVSGHLPFAGETVIDIIKKHCMDPVPPLLVLRPNVPRQVVTVIERALTKTPEERFSTVTEFAESLAGAAATDVKGAPLQAVQPLPRKRISETVAASPLPLAKPALKAAPKQLANRPAGRTWAVRVAQAVLVLGIAVAIFWPQIKSALGPPAGTQALAPQTAVGNQSADSTKPASRQPTQAEAATPPAPDTGPHAPVSTGGSVALRGIPRGATIALDGRRVRSSRIALRPDVTHVISVSLTGYETWAETLEVRQGQNLTRSVTLHPTRVVQSVPDGQPLRAPQGAAASRSLAPTGTAYITVGSHPLAAMTINGHPVPANPVVGFEVPAGAVQLHFTVADASGTWSYDTTVTVAAGDRKNLGRIALVKRP